MNKNTEDRHRVPAGVSAGGQFAAGHRKEANVGLGPARRSWRDVQPGEWGHQGTGDVNHVAEQRPVQTSTAFNDRMRLLVGAPAGAKVRVVEDEHSVNVYGCDTWETSSSVTVQVGSDEHVYDSLPELLTLLDFADGKTAPKEIKDEFLSRLGSFHVLDYEGGAGTVYGRVANADAYRLLIAVDEAPRGGQSQALDVEGQWRNSDQRERQGPAGVHT